MSLSTEYAVKLRNELERAGATHDTQTIQQLANIAATLSAKIDELTLKLEQLGARMTYQVEEEEASRPITIADLVRWHQDHAARIETIERAQLEIERRQLASRGVFPIG